MTTHYHLSLKGNVGAARPPRPTRSPRTEDRGQGTGEGTGDRGQGTGDRRQETGDRGQDVTTFEAGAGTVLDG